MTNEKKKKWSASYAQKRIVGQGDPKDQSSISNPVKVLRTMSIDEFVAQDFCGLGANGVRWIFSGDNFSPDLNELAIVSIKNGTTRAERRESPMFRKELYVAFPSAVSAVFDWIADQPCAPFDIPIATQGPIKYTSHTHVFICDNDTWAAINSRDLADCYAIVNTALDAKAHKPEFFLEKDPEHAGRVERKARNNAPPKDPDDDDWKEQIAKRRN